jgi:hypothetical protein
MTLRSLDFLALLGALFGCEARAKRATPAP